MSQSRDSNPFNQLIATATGVEACQEFIEPSCAPGVVKETIKEPAKEEITEVIEEERGLTIDTDDSGEPVGDYECQEERGPIDDADIREAKEEKPQIVVEAPKAIEADAPPFITFNLQKAEVLGRKSMSDPIIGALQDICKKLSFPYRDIDNKNLCIINDKEYGIVYVEGNLEKSAAVNAENFIYVEFRDEVIHIQRIMERGTEIKARDFFKGYDDRKDRFVPTQKWALLHLHTEVGSLLDVFRTADELGDDLLKKGIPGCAITDHGSLSGTIYAQRALRTRGIKCVLGIEAYVREGAKGQSHITLLAMNEKGWQNLLALNRLAINNYYRRPRMKLEEICAHNEGIICMTACSNGFINRRLYNKEPVQPIIDQFKEAFGDRFYFELMPNRRAEQAIFNVQLLKLAEENGIKCVLTTDSHYNSPEDKEIHDVIKAIAMRKVVGRDDVGFGDNTFCNLTEEQVRALVAEAHPYMLPKLDEIIANTFDVFNRCNYKFSENLGDTMPPIPDAEDFIMKKIKENIGLVYPKHSKEVVKERLDLELGRIKSKNYIRYFALVAKMYDYARKQNIMVGPGRGSSGGSLVAYLLRITDIDPIEHNLLFERFISEVRRDLPDIDMDFMSSRRDEAYAYLKDTYGEENVARISTFSTWHGRGALRDVARAFGITPAEVDPVAKQVVNRSGGDARASFCLRDTMEAFEVAKKFAARYPKVVDIAIRLEGRIRHKGIHAAGVVVCSDLPKKVPVEINRSIVATAWQWEEIEDCKITKYDVLSLGNLDSIDEVLVSANLTHADLPHTYDDPKVFETICKGFTTGVFQFEPPGATNFVTQLQPTNFTELVNATCLYRPGPLNTGTSKDYVERKRGKKWEYYHPALEGLTKDTRGLILTQEQVMLIMRELGGFSWSNSETVRKIISKSKGSAMFGNMEADFVGYAVANKGMSKEDATEIFKKVCSFGSYGFNRSHAAAYSIVTYWTAWLKTYYPLEFYSNLMKVEKDPSKLERLIKEAVDSGIIVKTSNCAHAYAATSFVKQTNTIWLGLNLITGIPLTKAKTIIKFGQNFQRIKNNVNENIMNILINIGYFDPIERNRKRLMEYKMPIASTLFAYAEDNSYQAVKDWDENTKLELLRRYLPWPRNPQDVPTTELDEYRIFVQDYLIEENEIPRKPRWLKGWAYDFNLKIEGLEGQYWLDSKEKREAATEQYITLGVSDGTGRMLINLAPQVYKMHKDLIESIMAGSYKGALLFAVHPFSPSNGNYVGRRSPRSMNCFWLGKATDKIPPHIVNGFVHKNQIFPGQYLITNIAYRLSQKGKRYATINCEDALGVQFNGMVMLDNCKELPKFGDIIMGQWNGSFFKPGMTCKK